MGGTILPRIGIFLSRFKELGLIGVNDELCLIVEKNNLREYMEHGPFNGHAHLQSAQEAVPQTAKAVGVLADD